VHFNFELGIPIQYPGLILSSVLAFPCLSYLILTVQVGAYVDQNYANAVRVYIACSNFSDRASCWHELLGGECIAWGSDLPSSISWYSVAGMGKFELLSNLSQCLLLKL